MSSDEIEKESKLVKSMIPDSNENQVPNNSDFTRGTSLPQTDFNENSQTTSNDNNEPEWSTLLTKREQPTFLDSLTSQQASQLLNQLLNSQKLNPTQLLSTMVQQNLVSPTQLLNSAKSTVNGYNVLDSCIKNFNIPIPSVFNTLVSSNLLSTSNLMSLLNKSGLQKQQLLIAMQQQMSPELIMKGLSSTGLMSAQAMMKQYNVDGLVSKHATKLWSKSLSRNNTSSISSRFKKFQQKRQVLKPTEIPTVDSKLWPSATKTKVLATNPTVKVTKMQKMSSIPT